MTLLRARRRRTRQNGWTEDRIVTFIVTPAGSGSVTFAAAAVGLSRKSAYALRTRDLHFAALWRDALAAAGAARLAAVRGRRPDRRKEPALSLSKGDEVDKVDTPPESFLAEEKVTNRTRRTHRPI